MNEKSNNPLQSDIKFLKGVGEHRAKLLNKLGIKTIGDILEHFPRDYINRKSTARINDLQLDERSSIVGKIVSVEKRNFGRKRSQLNVVITDGYDLLFCTWFRFGSWFTKRFEVDKKIWVSGVITEFKGSPQIIHPETEILDTDETQNFWHKRTVLPVYSLTEKITINIVRNLIYNAFSLYHKNIEETLPDSILHQYGWEPRKTTLQKMHFSSNLNEIQKIKERYAFEELFYTQLMFARAKLKHQRKANGNKFVLNKTYTTKLKDSLPFDLTSAQKRVIREIVEDMNSGKQMNRLLQGDVGSGKTIVTVFAMLLALENGFQAVLMAPTELLAEQHFRGISEFLNNQPDIKTALIKGGIYKGKKAVKEQIKNGEINIIIGTHALIQKDMEFYKIGFVAIDEQHRFGVEQRAVLSRKGNHPDLMYLSATPIPRSLALTVYGDLDISILDELPPGRIPIKTLWRGAQKQNIVFEEVREELKAGRQVYIVCPLIEESEKSDLLDAETLYKAIRNKIYPEFTSAILHGRMKTNEKDQIMQKFKEKEYQILVSTTVIEVGIDVLNATVMIIEHAERFGLSQLHQLRGRVGRGSAKSFCYLIGYPPISKIGRERLSTMVETTDGFVIAEKDLELRGPGEFFGTSQSGIPIFKHANIVRDRELLKTARSLAIEIIKEDFELKEHKILAENYFANFLAKEKLFEF